MNTIFDFSDEMMKAHSDLRYYLVLPLVYFVLGLIKVIGFVMDDEQL